MSSTLPNVVLQPILAFFNMNFVNGALSEMIILPPKAFQFYFTSLLFSNQSFVE